MTTPQTIAPKTASNPLAARMQRARGTQLRAIAASRSRQAGAEDGNGAVASAPAPQAQAQAQVMERSKTVAAAPSFIDPKILKEDFGTLLALMTTAMGYTDDDVALLKRSCEKPVELERTVRDWYMQALVSGLEMPNELSARCLDQLREQFAPGGPGADFKPAEPAKSGKRIAPR